MSSQLDNFLDRLNACGYEYKRNGNGYRGQCPGHGGKDFNLSISEGDDGRVLLKCFSHDCGVVDITSALGLTVSDLQPLAGENIHNVDIIDSVANIQVSNRVARNTMKDSIEYVAYKIGKRFNPELEKVYQYNNIKGVPVLYVLRFKVIKDGARTKEIRPVTFIDEKYYVGKINGIEYPVYNLESIKTYLQSNQDRYRIFICEGEKAADSATSCGLVCTTSSGGSGSALKSDWKKIDEIALFLKRKVEYIIVPDNDDAGKKYSQSVHDIISTFKSEHVIKIRNIKDYETITGLYEFPEKGDIADLIELLDGQSLEEIGAILNSIADIEDPIEIQPERELDIICDNDVTPQNISYLWDDKLPNGELTLINGAGSVGKTFLLCSIMATITAGETWPDGQRAEKGCVLFFSCEDSIEKTITKRFRDNGGDPSMMYYCRGIIDVDKSKKSFSIQEIKLLEKQIDIIERTKGPVRLIVFDPITEYVGRIDENKNNQVREALHPIVDLVQKRNIACVGIIHPRKGAFLSGSAAESVAGSAGYVNLARRVWQVVYDKESDQRYMLKAKNNIGLDPLGISFIISPEGVISYTSTEIKMDADEYFEKLREKFTGRGKKKERETTSEDSGKLSEVEDWLVSFVNSGEKESGPTDSTDTNTVWGAAKNLGYSKRLVFDAKKNLGIVARKTGKNKWVWGLPLPDDENFQAKYNEEFLDYQK